MERVILGKTGLEVSPICYGSWQLDEKFWGPANVEEHIAAMRRAGEVGVNFFDTADCYGNGRSEEVIGEALSTVPRDQVIITTKVYHNFLEPNRLDVPDLSYDGIVEHCEASLKRLRTDYIDVYLCHMYDKFTDIEETTRAMDDLKKQGKVRHYGMSSWPVEAMRLGIQYGDYEVLQPRFSFWRPETEVDMLPLARSQGMGVMTFSPLLGGLLTGKYTGDEKVERGGRYFRGELFKDLAGRVRKLAPIAEKYGITITQLVLAAVLANPMIHSCITGIRKPAYIEEAAGAMGVTIERKDYYTLRRTLGKLPG
ncbi:MAG: aldo/keto reductase [Planctomycetes bacterium]|nr:aldo/keto reductase [Planctomycetota bacterium]